METSQDVGRKGIQLIRKYALQHIISAPELEPNTKRDRSYTTNSLPATSPESLLRNEQQSIITSPESLSNHRRSITTPPVLSFNRHASFTSSQISAEDNHSSSYQPSAPVQERSLAYARKRNLKKDRLSKMENDHVDEDLLQSIHSQDYMP